MLQKFLNLKLKTKLLIGFLTLSTLLIIIGLSTYRSLHDLEIKNDEVSKSEELKSGIADVKFIVAHDLKLLMEIITTEDKQSLGEFWNQHKVLEKEYDEVYKLIDQLVNDSTWGENYTLDKDSVNDALNLVNEYRVNILLPTLEKVNELRLKQIELLAGANPYKDSLVQLHQVKIDELDNAADSRAEEVFASINEAEHHIGDIAEMVALEQIELSNSSKTQNIIMMIVGFILALAIAFFLSNYLVSNVNQLKDVIESLRRGVLPEKIKINSEDEIAEIINSVNHLTDGLKSTSEFAGEIGKGNFNMEFTPLSESDVLGNSLLNMRSSLVRVAEDERKRNWATEGMAKFGDILRSNNEGLDKLSDSIISSLVKYLGANQGGLFIVNDANPSDQHLELLACYAWNKKKFIHMRVESGEGLVGQAWQENDMLYITDVPQNFVKITSGLGEANPKCFLIVPLTVNDETFGVIEIASFNLFEDYQKEFVKKLAESIASTLATAKTNERTKVLLEQSQQQTEEMRAQEEEMRQNMEEMQATQEEMERKEGEMQKVMESMRQQEEEMRQSMEEMKATQEEMDRIQKQMGAQNEIINTVAIVSKTDLRGNITYVNDQFCRWAKYTPEELMGKNHRILRHEDMPAAAFDDMWKTISSGKIWRGEVKNKAKDGSIYWVDAIIAPIKGDDGKPSGYIAQRFVINEKKELEEKLNKLIAEKNK